ncbi:MAG: 2-C-methyl-D-erythritol 2,4-cyclodiphosphate synthase [Bacteroidia bacterium]|nr:2-C-methyl-D-erythritol 2,4-cyclodiphosphate synthase [Bacteroidia bacterium]
MKYRIGFGYDVHAITKHRPLILGGVKIDAADFGLDGHSDADVLLHAICDALLGAAALGDIGWHFPNTDNQYKNISSILLLEKVRDLLIEHHYTISNIDATLVMEVPKIKPYIPQMKATIAKSLHISESQVSIKATTNEGLGYVGKKEGINAYAVALIYSTSNNPLFYPD